MAELAIVVIAAVGLVAAGIGIAQAARRARIVRRKRTDAAFNLFWPGGDRLMRRPRRTPEPTTAARMFCSYGSDGGAVSVYTGRRAVELKVQLVGDAVEILEEYERIDETPKAPGSFGRRGTPLNGHWLLKPIRATEDERAAGRACFLLHLARRGAQHDPLAQPTRVGDHAEWHAGHRSHGYRFMSILRGPDGQASPFDREQIQCDCGRRFAGPGRPWNAPWPPPTGRMATPDAAASECAEWPMSAEGDHCAP